MNSSAAVTVVRGSYIHRLEDRIRQHVPKWIRSRINATRTQPLRSNTIAHPDCDSVIGQPSVQKYKMRKNYEDTKFLILRIARLQFQMQLLGAKYVKIRQPSLCKQKKFVFSLQLFE